jgi:hypothetical protein
MHGARAFFDDGCVPCRPSDLMTELARREKGAGIRPEPEVDLFMKVE